MKTNSTHILKQYFEGKDRNPMWKDGSGLNGKIHMMRHFPEKFMRKTTLFFQLDQPSMVSLVVYYPLLGKLFHLESGIKEKGKHSVEFDTGNLPAGIFVARLMTEYGMCKEYMRKVQGAGEIS